MSTISQRFRRAQMPGDWAELSAAHEAPELAAADERGGA